MGRKKALTEADICSESMNRVLCDSNCQGKIQVASVVKMNMDCCGLKTMS